MKLKQLICIVLILIFSGWIRSDKVNAIEIGFENGVQYVFCQTEINYRQTINFSSAFLEERKCHQYMEQIAAKQDQFLYQVFYIQMTNSTNSTLKTIESTLQKNYGNKVDQRLIFILQWPEIYPTRQDANEILQTIASDNVNLCLPLLSLVFIQLSWKRSLENNSTIRSELWEIYCTNNNDPFSALILSRVLHSSSSLNRRFSLSELLKISPRREDLRGRKLKVLARGDARDQGDALLLKHSNGSIELISGMTVSILKDLSDMLNFTVIAREGGGSMREASDGSLTGIGKQMIDGEGDLSIAMANLLSYRRRWLDFLPPIMRDRACTFFMQPGHVSRNILISPFRQSLWTALLVTCLIIFSSSIVIIKYCISTKEKSFTYGEMALWTIAAVCQQGWYETPRTAPMKTLFFVGSVTGMVTLIAYSGSIVAMLSHQGKAISGIEDLFTSGFALIGNTSTNYNHVLSSSDLEELAKRAADRIMTQNESIHEVFRQGSKIATTLNLNEFFYLAKSFGYKGKDLCEIDVIQASSINTRTGMFLRKGSDLREFLNLKIILLFERGLIWRYKYKYFTGILPACDKNAVKLLQNLELADLRFAHGIILFGMALSFLIFFLEVIYKWFHREFMYTLW